MGVWMFVIFLWKFKTIIMKVRMIILEVSNSLPWNGDILLVYLNILKEIRQKLPAY